MNRPSPRVLVPVLVAAALAAVALWWLGGGSGDSSLATSGTIEATETDLGFPLPGTVEQIAVHEGDAVAKGDTLAWLESEALRGRRAGSAAALEAARARLAELEGGFRPQEVAQARAAARATDQRLEEARLDGARARALFEGEAISKRELDRAETAFVAAQADKDRARAQLDLVLEGPRSEQVDAQRALVDQAEAVLRQADAELGNTRIEAPFGGIVTIRHREPGEAVPAGAPIVTVMDPADRWVRVYVREDAIGRVSIGQAARIASDTWPDREYDGEVTFIASQAEFTPATVQTEEERVKLVYAVKVRVTGDPAGELKTGTPADVRLLEGD